MVESVEHILKRLRQDGREYAVVSNPSYIFPPEEYYPLARPVKHVEHLKAVLMDMDGTTTTTEELCIYALDEMVRRMSGVPKREAWQGLDRERDYPHIIGNSTTKHVEYLISTYEEMLDEDAARREFLRAAVWTLTQGRDAQRRQEVRQNLINLGLSRLIDWIENGGSDEDELMAYAGHMPAMSFGWMVNLGIDIYYQVYHQMLALLNEGQGEELRQHLFGSEAKDRHLIAPMAGIPVLLPLLKGWLGSSAPLVSSELIDHYQHSLGRELSKEEQTEAVRRLTYLARYFEQYPVKVGLVTSSIHYEADVVIQEVFRVIRSFLESARLPEQKKQFLMERFNDYRHFYDAFVTASDSSEIRLKPHRDLYSLALHQLGLSPQHFDQVVGFEDSQSGTVAIRAAGIGCCVAVPFAQSSGHNFEAAVHSLQGGIPEALLHHQLFMNLQAKQKLHYE